MQDAIKVEMKLA